MRLMTVFLFAAFISVHATGITQKVTLSGKDLHIKKVFAAIEQQTGYFVFANRDLLARTHPVTFSVKDMPLKEFLELLLREQPVHFIIEENTIVLSLKKKGADATDAWKQTLELSPPPAKEGPIKVTVTDQEGKVLPGAYVRNNKTKRTSITETDGTCTIIAAPGEPIEAVFIGYGSQIVTLKENTSTLTIQLKSTNAQLGEVVINAGILTRNKNSFTGTVASFSGDELKKVGNMNLIQSLKTLDPSFIVLENNLQGANPNALPAIEVRGKTSVAALNVADQFGQDPNLPLFILDGFESSLQVISDLDMSRIASVTILKDAASTAIYGARAANGVVVIETLRPVGGELRVSYAGDLRVEVPDLNSYNLMNAAEKLEFEKLAGRYTSITSPALQYQLDELYNLKKAEVERGVNTYWLKEPVRTGTTQGHSLNFAGGNQSLQFGAGVTYRSINGAMKGSGRNIWSVSNDISYRHKAINITNRLYVSGYNANESPYGTFDKFVNTNPYYRKYNEAGKLERNLESSVSTSSVSGPFIAGNPLYNASLNNINRSGNTTLRDNLRMIYTINNNWRVEGGIQVGKETTETTVFKDPDHSDFLETTTLQKGSYSNTKIERKDMQANLMLTYGNTWGKHQVNSNLRGDVQQTSDQSLGFSAVGFPSGTNGNPVFAYSYTPASSPVAANAKSRRANMLVTSNYSYDLRFLADISYRLDGSTVFGSSKRYSPFWSAGLGWNLHREAPLRSISWINMFKIRANIGITGNQNLGSITSASVLGYMPGSNLFGQFLELQSLGNPNLAWQTTQQKSAGADISLFNNSISAVVNYFEKNTDPLIVRISKPASTGVNDYPGNVGVLDVKGWEANIKVAPINRISQRIIWNIGLTGSITKGRYSNFGTALDNLNKEQLTSNSLVRYHDGYSPDDIWAVVSRGIDPATGQEIFLKKSGEETFTYSSADIVRAGNNRPAVEGIISSNLTLKSFFAGINLRYRVGGDVLNNALYSRVENISLDGLKVNQDKRALYGRWRNPGDVAQFKAISLTSTTPMSSRFIQKDNQLIGESITLGWQFLSDSWINKLRMRQLRFTLYLNDIFRLTTANVERGINYPFANTVSFNLNASF